jgi:DNA-binding transcriptional ArsR family regulator
MPTERCDLLCLDLDRAEAIRATAPEEPLAEQLAERAKALGDPTRTTLAIALREGGELCVCDLSWILAKADNLISHHLRVMRRAGVAASRREGKMVLYSLTPHGRELLGALVAASSEPAPV